MSKELDLAEKLALLVEFMETSFKEEDGINKVAILKTVASYYESLVAAESMRAMIIKSMGAIK